MIRDILRRYRGENAVHEGELASEGEKAAGCGTPRRNGRVIDKLWLERCHGLDVVLREGRGVRGGGSCCVLCLKVLMISPFVPSLVHPIIT